MVLPHYGDATDDGTNNRYVESLLRRNEGQPRRKEGRKGNLSRKLLAILGTNEERRRPIQNRWRQIQKK
jgi:hypothetical protein